MWLIFFLSIFFISKDLSLVFPPSMSLNSLGLFGDSFNVLTSLFTGLAFAGVIISVILQTKELEEARGEFRGQKEALEKQQDEMKNQSFDNKFFQMLHLFNSIINSLIYLGNFHPSKGQYRKEGREVFKDLKRILEEEIKEVNDFNEFTINFKNFNNGHDTSFKYYFINLYQILKYIDNENTDIDRAKRYTNIVRAQLSKNELILLFYNAAGVEEFSGNNYKGLVEKYSFFEHLRYEDLKPKEDYFFVDFLLSEYYDITAFGKNDALIKVINNIEDNKTS